MTRAAKKSEPDPHEVFACYSNRGMGYQPHMSCSCGFRVTAFSWEEAGQEFDEHLAEVKAKGE